MATSDAMPSRKKPAGQDYALEAMLMLLAVVPVMVSAYASYITGDGHWFQRSGTLMVLFSVGVEYHRTYMLRCIDKRCAIPGPPGDKPAAVALLITRFWRSVPYVCYLAIFMGTMIWGYGDLLFR